MISIYTTHPSREVAQQIVTTLLTERLIACANFSEIENQYWWKWKIETSQEVVALLKTTDENWEKVRDKILEIHPYETPCIIRYAVVANEDYEQWVWASVKQE